MEKGHEHGKTDVEQLKGILEEFAKEDILAAIQEKGIVFSQDPPLRQMLSTAFLITSHNKPGHLLRAIRDLIDKHSENLSKSPSIQFLRNCAIEGKFPTTANEITKLLAESFMPNRNPIAASIFPNIGREDQVLCYENPQGVCNDHGCDVKSIIIGWAGGECIHTGVEIQGLFGIDACACFGEPEWWEIALWALFFLLLLLTPGPDEVAGVSAAIARFLVRIPAH